MPTLNDHLTSDFIKSYKEEKISFASLHFKEVETKFTGEKIILLSDSILDKYNDVLQDYVVIRTLTQQEFNKYQYNPKVLSYDLYGTVELWFLLLHVNQLFSVTQFNINPIKQYNPGVIRAIESIINLEKKIIDGNESDTIKKLKT